MNLPEWFGKNPDALWDILTGHIETPCEITLIGFGEKQNQYNKYELGIIKQVLNRTVEKYPNEFKIIYKDK